MEVLVNNGVIGVSGGLVGGTIHGVAEDSARSYEYGFLSLLSLR